MPCQDEDHPDVGLVLRMATTLSQCCKNDAKVVYLVGATVVQLSASQTAKAIVAQVSLHAPSVHLPRF